MFQGAEFVVQSCSVLITKINKNNLIWIVTALSQNENLKICLQLPHLTLAIQNF